tara:strand:+ start:73 stop:810 length:738 start_codon:yes stop_codon:yes gene_type:complete
MLKVAFIGDSFSAYDQAGQQENSWTYLLSEKFPQHQYYNYAYGGRGYDYYQLCLLDAKIRNIDVIIINATFNHRASQLISDNEFNFRLQKINDRYFELILEDLAWFTPHGYGNNVNFTGNKAHLIPEVVKNSIAESLSNKALSYAQRHYNDKWYENVDSLYNFKHIVKLSLLQNVDVNDGDSNDSACMQLQKAFEIDPAKVAWEPSKTLFDKGLAISEADDHWSPLANQWVLDNYILPRVVDILS